MSALIVAIPFSFTLSPLNSRISMFNLKRYFDYKHEEALGAHLGYAAAVAHMSTFGAEHHNFEHHNRSSFSCIVRRLFPF